MAEMDFFFPPGEVPAGSISNSELAEVAEATLKGRAEGAGTGAVQDLTGGQVTAILTAGIDETTGGSFINHALALAPFMTTWRFTAAGTVHGVAGGVDGQVLAITNGAAAGSGVVVTVEHFSSTGGNTATSRFLNWASAQGAVYPGDTCMWVYYLSRWRQIAGSAVSVLGAMPAGAAIPFTVRINCTSGGSAGTADDVTVWNAAAPFNLRILDATFRVSTAVGASTAALRTASGGGGSVVMPQVADATSTFSTATTGPYDDTSVATATVTSGGSLFLRRSDRSVVGELILTCIRT